MKCLFLVTFKYPEGFYDVPIKTYASSTNYKAASRMNTASKTIEMLLNDGHQVDIVKTTAYEKDAIPVDVDSYDKIFVERWDPEILYYPVMTKPKRDALIANKEKTIMLLNDPFDFHMCQKMLSIPYFEKKFHQKRYVEAYQTEEEITRWIDYLNYIYANRPKMISTFFNHPELKERYYYSINYVPWFEKQANIPFEQKENLIVTACGSFFRIPMVSHLRRYKLKKEDVHMLGCTFKVAKTDKEGKFISENEVNAEYAKYRYIFSPTYKGDCYSWVRTRFLYSAMNKCILLGTDPEIKYYGDAYNLDYSVFQLTEVEQKNIAEAQAEYFFKNLMPQDAVYANFQEALKK